MLTLPSTNTISPNQEDGKVASSPENHELAWGALGPVRNHREMCRHPGKDGQQDPVILSPSHRKNTPEPAAPVPEGLNTNGQ